jgi:nucleotide-binding universal stress UspA family protein
MTVYHKILVPYDSSKPSETALEHAIQIAKMPGISSAANTNINVILLHVVQDIPVQLLLELAYLNQIKQEI